MLESSFKLPLFVDGELCVSGSSAMRRHPRPVLGFVGVVEERRHGARDELYIHGTYVFLSVKSEQF